MTPDQMDGLLQEALKKEAPGRWGDVLRMSECQLYKVIRTFMHNMDTASGKHPRRYAYKAVAGGMSELIERRNCDG